jgi:hypothetical protein
VYTQTHVGLLDHPKFLDAAELLDGDKAAVLYHLTLLWQWAMTHAEDGDLTRYSDRHLERTMQWSGTPGGLIEILVDVGFLDREERDDPSGDGLVGLVIHDWQDWSGSFLVERTEDEEDEEEVT